MTLAVRFSRTYLQQNNTLNNIITSSLIWLAALLSNSLEHFIINVRIHYSAFDFTYEVVQTKTKKLEISFNIEFGRAVLSTVPVRRRNLWNHLRNPSSKRRDRNHLILFSYLVPVEKISI